MSIELDIPDIKVLVRTDPDYNVVIQNPRSSVYRSGSYVSIAELAVSATSASYALTASYAEVAGAGGFPYTGSAAITGSLTVTGSVDITDNLTVQGIISAEKLLVSSSVIYESGSTKFGDSPEDTHQFTGSLTVQGPISASGITGSFKGDGSQLTGLVTDLRISGSTGSDVVSLLTDDLTITGNNGIVTTVTNNTVTIGVPVGLTASLYGTASVADGIDVVIAGIYETGSDGVIIPAPSGGYTYISTASYALTASYIANNTWENLSNIPQGLLSSSVQVYYLPVESASYALSASYAAYAPLELTNVTQNSAFQIPLISASKLAVDLGPHLSFNPTTHVLQISGGIGPNGGIASISPRGVLLVSGSANSAIVNQFGLFADVDGKYVGLVAYPAKYSGSLPNLASYENPGIFVTSGSAPTTAYIPLEFQGSGSYTDGRVTANKLFVAKQGIQVTGSLTVSGSSTLTNIGPAVFSGSLNITEGVTGSLLGTSSWANIAVTSSYTTTASYAMNAGGNTFNISQLPDDTLVGDNISSSVGGTPIEIDYGISKGDFANRFTGIKVYNYDYSGGNLAGQVEIWTDSEAQDFSTRRFYVDGFGNSTFISNVDITGSLNIINGATGSLLGTASWAKNAVTASQALTASYALNAGQNIPTGTISSSTQVVAALPVGTVSSSTQISTGSLFGTSSWSVSSSWAPTVNGVYSSSVQISQSGFVSSSTINTIQTITSASYAGITPVSGTLYIIID